VREVRKPKREDFCRCVGEGAAERLQAELASLVHLQGHQLTRSSSLSPFAALVK
jgi:hypothetical protein